MTPIFKKLKKLQCNFYIVYYKLPYARYYYNGLVKKLNNTYYTDNIYIRYLFIIVILIGIFLASQVDGLGIQEPRTYEVSDNDRFDGYVLNKK